MRGRASRRSVLKGVAASGTALWMGSLTGSSRAAPSGETVVLGDFESGRDGWTTNGGNKLSRVTEEEQPGVVTRGIRALEVEVNGDSHPLIENKRSVRQANFVDHPYLIADVVPGLASRTESDITFQFSYHHTNTEADGSSVADESARRGKPVLVTKSKEITVPALLPDRLTWDMSGLDEESLSNPQRLEIAWYPSEHPPESGARGRNNGFRYEGRVYFDNIRLSDSAADVSAPAAARKTRDMRLAHGRVVETVVEERSDDVEQGSFVFDDGTEIDYAFEVLDDDRFRYTVDGEAFELGGGQ